MKQTTFPAVKGLLTATVPGAFRPAPRCHREAQPAPFGLPHGVRGNGFGAASASVCRVQSLARAAMLPAHVDEPVLPGEQQTFLTDAELADLERGVSPEMLPPEMLPPPLVRPATVRAATLHSFWLWRVFFPPAHHASALCVPVLAPPSLGPPHRTTSKSRRSRSSAPPPISHHPSLLRRLTQPSVRTRSERRHCRQPPADPRRAPLGKSTLIHP